MIGNMRVQAASVANKTPALRISTLVSSTVRLRIVQSFRN